MVQANYASRRYVGLMNLALIVVMVLQDPLLSAFALLIGPPLGFAVYRIMRRLRRVTRESVEVNSRLIGAMQEATQGIAIVKAFTMEEQLGGKIAMEDPHAFALKGSTIGDMSVELDSRILHPAKGGEAQGRVLPRIAWSR